MQENKEAERNRITYVIWIIVTMILGLSSRKFGPYLPAFVRDYAGDTLWALMVFWGRRNIYEGIYIAWWLYLSPLHFLHSFILIWCRQYRRSCVPFSWCFFL